MFVDREQIEQMEKIPRVQFATTLPGPKPICLVGTRNLDGIANLAPFSSVTHLGSNPVLIGMVTRPETPDRHTLHNIVATQCWTLNHVSKEIAQQAHQCSARYPADKSEFEATGLTELTLSDHLAPFVKESPVRIALTLEEIIDIPSNRTRLIVGRVQFVDLVDSELSSDGSIDISSSLASTALDTYLTVAEHKRFPYAKASGKENA